MDESLPDPREALRWLAEPEEWLLLVDGDLKLPAADYDQPEWFADMTFGTLRCEAGFFVCRSDLIAGDWSLTAKALLGAINGFELATSLEAQGG